MLQTSSKLSPGLLPSFLVILSLPHTTFATLHWDMVEEAAAEKLQASESNTEDDHTIFKIVCSATITLSNTLRANQRILAGRAIDAQDAEWRVL